MKCKFSRKKTHSDKNSRCYAFGDNTGFDYITCEGSMKDRKCCPFWSSSGK